MSVPTKSLFTTIGLLLAALVTDARGQINLPFGPENYYDQNLQIFAPVELDLDNLPNDDDSCGYFFGYQKLMWSFSGERVTVGDPTVVELAEEVYADNPQDLGTRPNPYQIHSTLTNVPPQAGFVLGDYYELGYRSRDNGWRIGVVTRLEAHQNQVYGLGQFNPTIAPDYTDGSDTAQGPVQDIRAFGFGSVPMTFDMPADFLVGFRDYLGNITGAENGTQWGPLFRVVNYGAPYGEPTDVNDVITYTDDINGNGIWGQTVTFDPDGNVTQIVTDYGDLTRFNVFWDQVDVHSYVQTDAVEVMWTHRLSNNRYMAKRQNNRLELSYGARFFRFNDNLRVDALGSILGDSFWDTSFDNQIVGPQIGLRWTNQRQRWTINADAKVLLGYNTQDWTQYGVIGSDLIPGGLNEPLYGRPTYFSYGLQKRSFCPVAELRVETAYHLTKAFALKAGYTGMFVGNIRRAAPSVRYYLPEMGYQNAGTQQLVINGLQFGVEFVH